MIARLNYYIQSFVINNPTYRRLYLITLKKFVFIVFNYSKFNQGATKTKKQQKKWKTQKQCKLAKHKTQPLKYKIQSKSYMAKYVFVYTPDVNIAGIFTLINICYELDTSIPLFSEAAEKWKNRKIRLYHFSIIISTTLSYKKPSHSTTQHTALITMVWSNFQPLFL